MTRFVEPSAYFDTDASAVIIERMTVRDPDVAQEARRWTTGERGLAVDDPEELARADLTNFVTEALRLGAHALSVTGQAQESRALEHMLKDVGDKAVELTGRAVQDAADVVTKAASEAQRAIMDADQRSREEFTTAVAAAKRDLNAELRRIFAGESPELVERLQPVLDRFGAELDAKVSASTTDLLAKVARQFDPADPTSPMAKHAAELNARQERLTERLTQQHDELSGKIGELATALRLREAKTGVAKVTPIKGGSYEDQIHPLMLGIASGLGDEYTATGNTVGHLPGCKKGDGVLALDSGAARVVIEMTDSAARRIWGEYLDEAERNRGAVASLGLVRTAVQNGHQTIRVIGARRIVMAFDPDTDDPELLRTAVMLLRAGALVVSARKGAHQIATAEERITEALAQLAKIDNVKTEAATIQKSVIKIERECTSLNTAIRRLLDQALAALAGVESSAA